MAKSNSYTETLTLQQAVRVGTSQMGNPTYEVTFTSGKVARTEVNGSIGYSITNRDLYPPLAPACVVTFTKSGRITNVVPVS